MGRRPTIQYRAQCGPSSLLLLVSVARCPKALAPRMSPCRVFQIRLRFRGIQKSSSRPRWRPAEGLRKLAEVNRRRSGRRKPAEARLRPAENKLVFQDRSMLATVPCSGLQSLPNTYGVHKSPICSMLYFSRYMGPWRSPRLAQNRRPGTRNEPPDAPGQPRPSYERAAREIHMADATQHPNNERVEKPQSSAGRLNDRTNRPPNGRFIFLMSKALRCLSFAFLLSLQWFALSCIALHCHFIEFPL